MIRLLCIACLVAMLPGSAWAGDEPALPAGLSDDEPALPLGIDGDSGADTPEQTPDSSSFPFDYRGFIESRAGTRVFNDNAEKQASIGELRVQTQIDSSIDQFSGRVTTDLVADPVADSWAIDLENGDGFLDLREAYLFTRAGEYLDLKVGRQVLTWGTGDYLFINDLFPKDWNSFFIGRDDEYLKAPSDAIRATFFSDLVNLDVAYTPLFDSDRFIDGRRVSFFNAGTNSISGRHTPLQSDQPSEWFQDDEIAARIYRKVSSYELALYGYNGYWKSPGGFSETSGKAIFPRLAVYGASARGPLASGIANLEAGYYDSQDDRSGRDPFVRNSEVRALAGYEHELAQDLTLGLQYYVEKLVHYDSLRESLPPSAYVQDEYRQLITTRLTKFLLNQNLKLGLFAFYSPTDQDAYPRANVSYKVSDSVQAEIGTNFFVGEDDRSFFGMFEDNSNMYAAVRYSFIGGSG